MGASFTDGKAGLKDPVLVNLNVLVGGSPLAMHWTKDSLKAMGRTIEHTREGEGDWLGSDTKASGVKKGSISLQMNAATDVTPSPAHILQLTKGAVTEFYIVGEDGGENERNQVVKGTYPVVQAIHPFFKGLLSVDLGDSLALTKSIATGGPTSTLATNPVNHRTGSTKTYSALQSDGSAVPAGVAINASTGVITFTHASLVIGVYTIKVTALDVLTGQENRESENTLILTVTA